ncbi:hypothetical protein HU200_048767 [Digitaria exilis]|uniref:Protein kinase domain-containing protein n=1 Tax=Digitaria exilis TaxID=1010633 RepID=A0A835AU60_9POAL|nr:hypothetical protein HU200_048767 [Digitaria exilis]
MIYPGTGHRWRQLAFRVIIGVADDVLLGLAMSQALGYASNVAQFVIAKIEQMARTASQNRADCEHLARRVGLLGELLSQVRGSSSEPVAAPTMAELDETLVEAHDLVESCQRHGRTYHFFTASRIAQRFSNVDKKIDSYLQHFQAINNIAIDRLARRLDALMMHTTNGASAPRDTTIAKPGADTEFSLADITLATNDFAVVLGSGDSGTVYKGKLHNGREVAVKRLRRSGGEDRFDTELALLAPLQHHHIVRLLGRCAEDGERIVVTELMTNGSLHEHLHGHRRSSSPVTSSWKAHVEVLLGVARGVEHLHRRAMPLVIHAGVTSSHILLGHRRRRRRPASDVYSLGVVMLETLTGKPAMLTVWDEGSASMAAMALVSYALPSVRDGRLVDVLDRRPVAAAAARQLEPLQMVASMAARCLCLHGDNRPGISEVVVNLERALQLICTRLGYASTVAQLAGVDPVGLIAKIKQMARTASQNRADCEHLAGVDILAGLLSRLRGDPVAAPTMAGVAATLREAHELVVSCHGHGRTVEERREEDRILSQPLPARRLDALTMHPATNGSSAPRHTTMATEPYRRQFAGAPQRHCQGPPPCPCTAAPILASAPARPRATLSGSAQGGPQTGAGGGWEPSPPHLRVRPWPIQGSRLCRTATAASGPILSIQLQIDLVHGAIVVLDIPFAVVLSTAVPSL